MAFEFEWIALAGFGGSPQIAGKQEGKLTIALDMGESRFYPQAEVAVLVDRKPELTWAELEQQARVSAIETLRVALEALESGTIEELRVQAISRREENDAANAARQAEELREKISKGFGREG